MDLRAIQRSEELISHVAAVSAGTAGGPPPGAGTDPGVAALLALATDVAMPGPVVSAQDRPQVPAGSRAGAGARRAGPARRAGGRARRPAHGRPAPGVAAWLRAAAAGALVAGLAGTTSLIAASMLARLYRVAGVRNAPRRGWGPPARHRRGR